MPRLIGIVRKNRLVRIARRKAALVACQRGSEGGYRLGKARLVHGDYIHIPLAKNKIGHFSVFLCKIKGKEVFCLFENRSIRRIVVFRTVAGHFSSAEADHISSKVDYREHDPITKNIVISAVSALSCKAGGFHLLIFIALFRKHIAKRAPFRRRIPKPKVLYGFRQKPPPEKIAKGGVALRLDKAVVIKACRLPVHLKYPCFQLCRAVLGCVLRNGHPGTLGKKLYRLDILKIFYPADKSYHIAARPAAEAIKGLAFGIDGKGAGFLRVKRA